LELAAKLRRSAGVKDANAHGIWRTPQSIEISAWPALSSTQPALSAANRFSLTNSPTA
jgi:hypothetical protein